jgi:hypothetical protein
MTVVVKSDRFYAPELYLRLAQGTTEEYRWIDGKPSWSKSNLMKNESVGRKS